MSQSAYNSLALHEILLSIANSLNEAQHQLRNMPPYDEYGRPNTLYQLPYLDFNLEVISQFESTEKVTTTSGTSGGVQTKLATMPAGGDTGKLVSKETFAQVSNPNAIRFVPFRSTETNTKDIGTITSTISGRFVAVMPNEGLPQIFLSCTSEKTAGNAQSTDYKLTIKVLQATNAPIAGQRIEVNFDELTSTGINGQAVSSPLFLGNKDGYTNSNGEFILSVRLNNTDYNSGKIFVFVANSGTQFSSVAISNV